MNPVRTLRSCAAALVLAPLALLAPSLAAQAVPGAAWREVMRGDDGTTVSIDSARVDQTSRSNFIVRTAVRFPQPMQLESGAPIDREIDMEELDCDSARIRGIESLLLLDTRTVRRVLLSRAWEPVPENRRPLFDARCAWLVGSFGVGDFALERDAAELDSLDLGEMPELANRGEVARELARAYPRELLRAGMSGMVTVKMRLLENGTVDDPTITILDTTAGFAEGAVSAVQRMRFRPARLEGRPVKVWVTLPVTFVATGTHFEVNLAPAGSPGHPLPPPEIIQRADPGPPPLPPSRRP
ncbi:MAG: energy transducer TonB [Longimicrobiaceae bacterium]